MRKLDFAKPTVHPQGQTLLELIIAIGIFITVVSGLAFFILESYISGRLASEITKANFLAEEGMEAVRSIRDNNWGDLLAGNYGLAIFENKWIFQGAQEDINSELKGGIRVVTIEDIDPDRKKLTSQVTWQFTQARPQEVRLVTYLTNWAKLTPPYVAQLHYRWRNDDGGE